VVIPLLLAVLAPALESLLATSRPVLASAAVVALTAGAVLLRLLGRLWLELGRLVHHLYDLILFVPLAIEQTLAQRRAVAAPVPEEPGGSAKVARLPLGKARSGAGD
jgi:hypothetical protein